MIYDEDKLKNVQVLLVGAGGIGCELLKNLVLTGFRHITIIDLDTIDVSNLNRQFLFGKEHVGKSKAQVARESALALNPDVEVVAHHDNIMSSSYGVPFFKKFQIVLNALDNRAARSHVNRMCLSADVPLIESGTAGYLGQVSLIKKNFTGCYDCDPKPTQKTFPGCTIRNTPSELIHCIVWAKHLYNQLFGEPDADQDVSPDTEDPEAAGDAGKSTMETEAKKDKIGGLDRKSTRVWAEEENYCSRKLFNKFFNDDIKYLLSMANLWKKRTPPTPLNINDLPEDEVSNDSGLLTDQKLWSLKECVEYFHEAVNGLKEQIKSADGNLVWDKDDEAALNFVTSSANIRAFIFHIQRKSKFDIKSMAGNIIPAIATTNAVAAGLIMLEALKVLAGRFDLCRAIYINKQPNGRRKLLVPCAPEPKNPKCYVCSEKREITVTLNVETFTLRSFEEKVLKGALGMMAPDVEVDGKGTILISSEEGETDDNMDKFMSDFGIVSGTRLKCDDFHQEYDIVVNIYHMIELPENKEYEIVGNVEDLLNSLKEANETKADESGKEDKNEVEDDDDLMVVDVAVEENVDDVGKESRKRKRHDDDVEETTPSKKRNVIVLENVMVLD